MMDDEDRRTRACACGSHRVGTFGTGPGNFRDRGDGFCSACGRTVGWHAGRSCYPPCSTGMPRPVASIELRLFP